MNTIIVPSQKTPGYPKKKLRQLESGDIVDILSAEYAYDAHFVQYSIIPEIGAYRYTRDLFAAPEFSGMAVSLELVVIDVDCPNKGSKEPGVIDFWWDSEQVKIDSLLKSQPGMVWRTNGGWRGCWRLTPRELKNLEDCLRWQQDYLAYVAYLERVYDIVADHRCADWGRLQRVPFGRREGETQTVRRPLRGAL